MTEEYEYSPPNEKSMPLFDTERGTGFSLTVFLYLCPLMDGEKQRIASRVRKLAVEVSLPNLQVRSVLLTVNVIANNESQPRKKDVTDVMSAMTTTYQSLIH
jgi:hypothetical protein